jgi:hypothetical protein
VGRVGVRFDGAVDEAARLGVGRSGVGEIEIVVHDGLRSGEVRQV